jgi:hypothetical protein
LYGRLRLRLDWWVIDSMFVSMNHDAVLAPSLLGWFLLIPLIEATVHVLDDLENSFIHGLFTVCGVIAVNFDKSHFISVCKLISI